MPHKNALRKTSRSNSQPDVSLTRKASDLFKRTVSKVMPTTRDRKPSKTSYSRIEDPPGGSMTDAERAAKAQPSESRAGLVSAKDEATNKVIDESGLHYKDNMDFVAMQQSGRLNCEDPPERQQVFTGQRPVLKLLSPNQQRTDAIMQVPATNDPYPSMRKPFHEAEEITERSSLDDDIFGNESAGSVLRSIDQDEPSSSRTGYGEDALRREFPVTATIELTQHIMPCFDFAMQASDPIWLLVDMKCVSIFGANSRAAALCPGRLENLTIEIHMPTGHEVVKYCGAVQQRLMTTEPPNNSWSVAICVCRTNETRSLRSRIASSVSSTVSMIDGFLKALRADSADRPKMAVQYRITAHQGSPSKDNMLVVRRFCGIPEQEEKRISSQQLDEVRGAITRVSEGNDDPGSYRALLNDFYRWRANRNASGMSRISSLVPRPLFGTRKARGGREEDPARI